jgi:hypothetical protein
MSETSDEEWNETNMKRRRKETKPKYNTKNSNRKA